MTDEQQIRDLIERRAAPVDDGDLPVVLADHAPDIVMFDVPPPEQGVRGIEAYRATWPGFFDWQASGARVEIDALDVTAGRSDARPARGSRTSAVRASAGPAVAAHDR